MTAATVEPQVALDIDSRRSAMAGYSLGVALGLTSATQLRIPGLAIGAGEVLLVLWLGGFGIRAFLGKPLRVSATTVFFALFWLAALAVLCFGWILGVSKNVNGAGSTRDFLAYVLSAALTLVILGSQSRSALFGALIRSTLITVAIPLSCLGLLAVTGHPNIGPVHAMFGVRFRGWALNPNQVALICSTLPFFGLEITSQEHGVWKFVYAALSLACVVIGIATLSDALFFAWLVSGAVLGLLLWLSAATSVRRSMLLRWAAIFGLPLILAGATVVRGDKLVQLAERAAVYDYNSGGQGSDRMIRWKNGLAAAAASPIIGLGPGSFSGPAVPFSNEEAHNTAIDWVASTGAVGLTLLVAVAAWFALGLIINYQALTFACGVGFSLFTMFHFVLRQPVFWVYLLVLAHRPRQELR